MNIDLFEVSQAEFIEIEHHFMKEPDMKINIDNKVAPTCVTITNQSGIVARARLPRRKKENLPKYLENLVEDEKFEPEYMVSREALNKYFSDKVRDNL